ncbi:hypothetical protein SARC_03834 [Sphaeroforma arctica JP610]|uniref:Uncharacterized protein n=1 Tax=Sphaeroforma arctica JP610 TaxID=667725 RepID=A0A0L0G4F8_9EUKA|nr:hypothetical protein SARC_03834 [Sphaeroforma arctica JP610]KNC83940.1 hypothetical protein SARC_03834 [Sphaeroforma arctica JP610]|eukprot:XP_014157842.1 hypothetical protein SARC_03834 [Sphaeroforma arctica JP610]
MALVYCRRASDHVCDIGAENTCAKIMQLCAAEESLVDNFDEVTHYLQKHLNEIIGSVHSMDKDAQRLMADDGVTQVCAPPAPEAGDSHGGLLLKTYSEKIEDGHVALTREFKVHSVDGKKNELRYVITRANGPGNVEHIERKTFLTVIA